MVHHTPDGPAEMLECLDILLSAALHNHALTEWDPYDRDTPAPVPPYTQDEFDTALWQTAQLGMNLLLDQEALVQTLDEMTQAQEVSRIITPELDDIQRINER